MFDHTVSVSFIEFFHAKMIYARVVVFSFLFVALYILPFVLFFIFFCIVLYVFLCMCVCLFFSPLFRTNCALLAGWLLDRSVGSERNGSDRLFDRLIDSSVGGSRVTLSSFLLFFPLAVLHLNYLCMYFMQSVITSKIFENIF